MIRFLERVVAAAAAVCGGVATFILLHLYLAPAGALGAALGAWFWTIAGPGVLLLERLAPRRPTWRGNALATGCTALAAWGAFSAVHDPQGRWIAALLPAVTAIAALTAAPDRAPQRVGQ